jgi:hypothetical protein
VAWSAPLGGNGQPNSTPTVANGVVFVGEGNGGRVHAYDARTGTQLWQSGSPTTGATYAAPTVAAGRLYAGSWDGFAAASGGTIRAWTPSTPSLTVAITAPAAGATLSGTVQVTASASSAAVGVQLKLDGANLGPELTSPPYGQSWNTTLVANGSHTLTAVARDAGGNTVTSAPVTVTVQNGAPPPTHLLVGDQAVEPIVDSNAPGQAEAFRSSATASGTLAKATVYVDATSAATKLVVGVYTDNGGHPGTLIAQGSLASPVAGAWNDVPLAGGAIAQATPYWLALLSPAGTLRYRDRCCRGGGTGASETSQQTSLSALPAAWTTGNPYLDAPASTLGAPAERARSRGGDDAEASGRRDRAPKPPGQRRGAGVRGRTETATLYTFGRCVSCSSGMPKPLRGSRTTSAA